MPSRYSKEELESYVMLIDQLRKIDITLREAEFPVRDILDQLPVGVFVSDEIHKPIYLNKIAAKFLRETIDPPSNGDLEADPPYTMYYPGTNNLFPREESPGRVVYRTKQTVPPVLIELRNPHHQTDVLVSAFPLFDKAGVFRYAVSCFWPITEHGLIYEPIPI